MSQSNTQTGQIVLPANEELTGKEGLLVKIVNASNVAKFALPDAVTDLALFVLTDGDEVRPEHLEGVLRRSDPGAATPDAAATLRDFKGSAERAFLVQKLRENRWNISATATAVGTPRSNLYKKLEQYGISQEKDG